MCTYIEGSAVRSYYNIIILSYCEFTFKLRDSYDLSYDQ